MQLLLRVSRTTGLRNFTMLLDMFWMASYFVVWHARQAYSELESYTMTPVVPDRLVSIVVKTNLIAFGFVTLLPHIVLNQHQDRKHHHQRKLALREISSHGASMCSHPVFRPAMFMALFIILSSSLYTYSNPSCCIRS